MVHQRLGLTPSGNNYLMSTTLIIAIVAFLLAMAASGVEFVRSRAVGWLGVFFIALGLLVEVWH